MLDAMAKAESLSLARLIRRIDEARGERPLASACRVAGLSFASRFGDRQVEQKP
jgi:predicted DNA-binding ribbon-helix-helix protein